MSAEVTQQLDRAMVDDLFGGAMPKQEIQAAAFLKEHPAYDGRGVVVAIFDTGVDPGAAGLQTTTDGRPKVIDVVDCTGSGDVDTSKVVRADEDGCITGLNGNKLRLNPAWTNPSGEWRVGAKAAYELFPAGLKSRLQKERKKRWAEKQRTAVAQAVAAQARFAQEHPPGAALSEQDKKEKEELDARVKLLSELDEKYEDLGPMLDCVVWHDGEAWQAALDTSDMYEPGSGDGALADFTPMTNYRAKRQWGTFSAEDACNFALNIYDNGDILSIVVDAGSHGTHVAGITAAHHPEDPALNGIAPGAQIVSCKIGDTRLGSMETLVGLTRALITVLENECDLVNMSYGEATATPNAGRFIQLAEELVYKHHVIFVASAGNAGPALSTVGAPGGTSSAVLGIGAYVSPALAAAGHSVRGEMEAGQQYTWSSRGPAPDGDLGVNFSAPGGAIAPVPTWTQQKRQLMNGTSMASPCACGGLALLVSALKGEGQAVTPARIRRAVENTCLPVAERSPDGVLTYGRGLLQVDSAYKYLRRSAELDVPADLRFEVTARRSDGSSSRRGIYLRDPQGAKQPLTFHVDVSPKLHEGADTRSDRLGVEHKLLLLCTAHWVKAPAVLLLHHNGRGFEVELDPTALPEGLHYAELQAFDAIAEWRGPLFRLPITVIKPLDVETEPGSSSGVGAIVRPDCSVDLGTLHFQPGAELRRFVAVPGGATWAELKIRAGELDTPKSYMLRATALLPHTRYSDSEWRSFTQLSAHQEMSAAFAVTGGTTLELTFAQYWSSLGDASLSADLSFHGVQATPAKSLLVDGAAGPAKVYALASLRREKVKPQAKLDVLRIPLRPAEAELAPLLGARDTLPEGRVTHRLLLTYKLKLEEGGKVTPTLPALNRYVYDGELEAQMYMVFDGNKQRLAVGDIYPEPVQLKKGEYTIRVVLRHDDAGLLDKLKAMPMVVERKLDQAIQVPVYDTNSDAVKGSNAVTKERTLCKGERAAYFLGPVPEDKLPKDAAPGRLLAGSLTLGLLPAAAAGNGGNGNNGRACPAAVQLTFLVPPKKAEAPAPKDEPAPAPAGEEGQEGGQRFESRLAEALRDAQVKFLKELKCDTEEERQSYEELQAQLLAAHPAHLPLLLEALQRAQKAAAAAGKDGSSGEGDGEAARLQEAVVRAADAVVAAIDQAALAIFLAQKCGEEGPGAAARKKDMEERKSVLIEALAAKCGALLELQQAGSASASTAAGAAATASTSPADAGEVPPAGGAAAAAAGAADAAGSGAGEAADTGAFEAAFRELRKWVDTAADEKYVLLHAKRDMLAGRLASAYRTLDKVASPEDKPAAKDVLELRAQLLGQLGWAHWERHARRRMGRQEPELLLCCKKQDGTALELLWRATDGIALLGVETYRGRLWERKVLRDGSSGNVLLTAQAWGLRRRHWQLRDHNGDVVLDVYLRRMLWRFRRHGKGPVRYKLRAFEPYMQAPSIIAGPEHSRLVVRQCCRYGGAKGDALCEAAYGAAAALLGDGPMALPAAAVGEAAGGCQAAIAPRADQPLMALLLSIYRGLMPARALRQPR
ncbi:Tripeptidyl-peptidase 2 isoform A [Chlorella sorokiniana]|nr:Tripeptidyl-peptidase 2 isoform A [Chlorella sorokiniana]|eukprot:PRW39066.1 Tripeptidyl-peptidase 2 isoform A [Chlorella sorokiniana]